MMRFEYGGLHRGTSSRAGIAPTHRCAWEFLPGRPRFTAPGAHSIPPNCRPPFGCALLIWGVVTAQHTQENPK